MDQVHLHLLITHLPIFGSVLAALVLAYAIVVKSQQTTTAAYGMLALSSIGALIAYLTGEGAEEAVEGLPGVMESIIEQHEEFAMFALIALLVTGAASIFGIVLGLRKSALASKFSMIVLLLSAISFGLVARTGYLGGQIRHTEIRTVVNGAGATEINSESEEHDDD
mgnify:CR=1 FL=1